MSPFGRSKKVSTSHKVFQVHVHAVEPWTSTKNQPAPRTIRVCWERGSHKGQTNAVDGGTTTTNQHAQQGSAAYDVEETLRIPCSITQVHFAILLREIGLTCEYPQWKPLPVCTAGRG